MWKAAALVLIAVFHAACASTLPSAPLGCEWHSVSPPGVRLLRVTGWSSESSPTTTGWFYSNTLSEPHRLAASLVLSIRNPEAGPASAEQTARATFELQSRFWEPLRPVEAATLSGNVALTGFFVRSVEPDPEPRHKIFLRVLVNPRTGITYVLIFETPESLWDEKWRLGQLLVGSLQI
jgi:hypothetical protein